MEGESGQHILPRDLPEQHQSEENGLKKADTRVKMSDNVL